MRARLPRLAIVVAAVSCLGAAPAMAADSSLLACWSTDALAGKPGENISRKHNRSFDAAPTDGWLLDPKVAATGSPLGAVRRVNLPPGKKLIALTFDLCEQPGEIAGYEGEIIDYLRRSNVKATFFAGGKWMRSHEERTQQLMADPLFELGNHSEAHRNLRLLDGVRLSNEVIGPQRAFEDIRTRLAETQCAIDRPVAMQSVPARLTLFRFPYGACNERALRAVRDQGLSAIQWDISTGDPSPLQSSGAIVRAMLRAKAGSIILNHANGRGWHTAAAIPIGVEKLRKMGFEFVTVSELLAAGAPVVTPDCYDSRPGDTDRYDHPLGLKPPALQSSKLPWWP
ncbi:MAG: polysaccharide deacetylase family protein [Hyphomicrobium sp.]